MNVQPFGPNPLIATGKASGHFVATRLPHHLENDFQLDRGAEWKACDARKLSRLGFFSFPRDVLQQLRRAVSNFRLIATSPEVATDTRAGRSA